MIMVATVMPENCKSVEALNKDNNAHQPVPDRNGPVAAEHADG
jgi:hypothetical protein